jgi:hypothetical protein
MAPLSSKWPELATSGEISGTSHDCIMNTHVDATALYRHIKANDNLRVPTPIVQFLQNAARATDHALRHPLGMDWKASIHELKTEILDLRKEVKAQITTSITTTNRIATYAQAAARAPPPGHASSNGTSTPGITPTELRKDREVIVKLGTKEAIQRFRSMTPKKIKDKAERARVRAARAQNSPPLAAAEIFAAGQLKSGDVQFVLGTAAHAEILRQNDEWVKYLSQGASVRTPTWGVVVHDIPGRACILPDNMTGVIDQLLADNRHHWGKDARIMHVSWLARPPVGKRSAIVAEFTKPQHANKAIEMGTIWDSTMLNAELYDRSARVRQCFNCQQYGHVGSTCSNPERCGHCAGSHQTRDCATSPQDRRKCANCGSAHASWSKACEYRQREVDRIAQLALNRPRYHRVPTYVEGASSSGSRSPSPERRSGASSTETSVSSEPVDSAAHTAPSTQASSGKGSPLNRQAPGKEDAEPRDPSSSGAQAPTEEPSDTDMEEAPGALTPGMELTEVSGNARRRMPRKAAAAARRGSGSMAWAAAAEELVASRGIFTFRTLGPGHSGALGPRQTRNNTLIRVNGPRRSPRIGSASGVNSLTSGGTIESVLNTNVRKRRRADDSDDYEVDNNQALVLASTTATRTRRGLQGSSHALKQNVRRLTAPLAQNQ